MQHTDHTNREREHGAGGEREGREEEEGPKDQLSKCPLLFICSVLFEFNQEYAAFYAYLILFLLFQAQKRKPEGTPEGRGRKKKLKL